MTLDARYSLEYNYLFFRSCLSFEGVVFLASATVLDLLLFIKVILGDWGEGREFACILNEKCMKTVGGSAIVSGNGKYPRVCP